MEREWNAQYWARNTTLTLDEYYEDGDNWDRAVAHAWDVVYDRSSSKKVEEDSDDDDDNDDDDDDDDDDAVVAEGEEDDDEEEDEDDSTETGVAGGTSDVIGKEGGASGKSKKGAAQTEADTAKVMMAFVACSHSCGRGSVSGIFDTSHTSSAY